MENLGKAHVKVTIYDSLPYIDMEASKFNFDVSAHSWRSLQKSPFFPPLLTEQVSDDSNAFAACFPSKRKYYIDNFLSLGNRTSNAPSEPDAPYILFNAIDFGKLENQGLPLSLFKEYDEYNLKQPYEYLENTPPDYIGPKWASIARSGIAIPNDRLAIKQFREWLVSVVAVASSADQVAENLAAAAAAETTIKLPIIYFLNQEVVRDGLWWGVESSPFLLENMPFWVNLKIAQSPASRKYDTVFIISLGVDNVRDKQNSYDIYISRDNKPRIIDYYKGRGAKPEPELGPDGSPTVPESDAQGPPVIEKEFDVDLSRVLYSQEDIEIGVMTIAGRLVVWVNQVPLVYTRVDKSPGEDGGKLKECKIAKGKIRVYGTNVQASINVCPMTFAELSVMALPISTIGREADQTEEIQYKGVTSKGEYSGPVCVLPKESESAGRLFGVDCNSFEDGVGSVLPEGQGFHRQGEIKFKKADSFGVRSLPGSDFYILTMRPETIRVAEVDIPYGGAPYFFRLKGGAEKEKDVEAGINITTQDVMSASETISAPDMFHAEANASVTLYNKGGKFDFLRDKQHGIRISWGWDIYEKRTFTGIIVGTTTSEVPGQETITLQCEDYMHILKNTPIVNSPFYDGMVAYYALEDLGNRASLLEFTKDWDDEDDYFLPSGYSFSKPLMRFPSTQKIFECMINIVQRFEAFIYFDKDGKLHVNKLPGGLFSIGAETATTASFTRNPDGDPDRVILNEKALDYNFASTSNRISIFTLDRDTRNAIIYTRSAQGNENKITFRRVLLHDQAALGDIEVARTWAERLAQRVFWPTRKTSFAAIGSSDVSVAKIFDFIQVDGDEFRVMSVTKKYNAESNDFTNEYGVEWLGGQ